MGQVEIRDKNGLTLEEFLAGYNPDKYPKPAVTADICIFACEGEEKELLLIRRGGHPYLGCWALPGGFAERGETIEHTAERELKEETGITGVPLELVGVYSEPGRDPRGWTISAAYAAVVEKGSLVASAGDDAADAAWFRVICDEGKICLVDQDTVLQVAPTPEGLAFDHAHIVSDAVAHCFPRV